MLYSLTTKQDRSTVVGTEVSAPVTLALRPKAATK